MNPLVRRWTDFWFRPKHVLTLGVCRALFFGLMFYYYVGEPFAGWAHVPMEFWKPHWAFAEFNIPVFSERTLFGMEVLWKTCLAAACVGLFTQFSTAVSFVFGIYLLGLRHNYGKLSHDDALPIFIMAILMFSRCGDGFSVDALIRRWRANRRGDPLPPLESGEYRWPMRAVWLVLAMIFFNSAIAKLRVSGLEWAFSENLSVLMVRHNYYNNPKTDWGLQLAQIPWFGHLMGAAALGVELFFPLILFSRIARWILVPMAFLMQQGNKYLLGVDFTPFMFAYLFFIDWEWLLRKVRRRPEAREETSVARETAAAAAPVP